MIDQGRVYQAPALDPLGSTASSPAVTHDGTGTSLQTAMRRFASIKALPGPDPWSCVQGGLHTYAHLCCLLANIIQNDPGTMLMKAMHCSKLGLYGTAPARGKGTYYARIEVATSIRRAQRCPPARFQIERHLGWAPAKETFDEKDRQKAVQISMRFDDADRNK